MKFKQLHYITGMSEVRIATFRCALSQYGDIVSRNHDIYRYVLPLSWCLVTFMDICTHRMEGSRYSSLLVASVHYFQTDPVPINALTL
jgi:hypothetical protein